MIFLKLLFGVAFFILGLVYLYKPNLVLQVNRIARDKVFNDRSILVERKKLAILFFCFSFVALYMGFTALSSLQEDKGKENWITELSRYKMYQAMQDYCDGHYQDALQKYQEMLAVQPNNYSVTKRMAYTYAALGEKKKAEALWRKLALVIPDDRETREQLEKLGK